jgi:asparagine synthase (glutamine-hydrolysing)
MCGIFAYLGSNYKIGDLISYFMKIQKRGPDSSIMRQINKELILGFHRLSIVDLSHTGEQPLYSKDDNIVLICNGEIYNHQDLKDQYDFNDCVGNSDCEVIIHMYKKFGIEETINQLDGVFSFILYDNNKDEIFVGRDSIGIRPLFYGFVTNEYIFASEIKAMDICDTVYTFPPGSWWSNKTNKFTQYYNYDYTLSKEMDENIHINNIRKLYTMAVNKRMMSDVKICCLLSGGLDSVITTCLASKHYKPNELDTYTIGMPGAIDFEYAKLASEYLKTNHHEIILSEGQFFNSIPEVIYAIESYDTTSVRASIGNYLICKYIQSTSDNKVVLNGDCSDEIFASYRGMSNCTDPTLFFEENVNLVKNLHYFDVLRSDRSISQKLEARTPFADIEFLNYVMSIDPKLKMFDMNENGRIEKHLLRKAFEHELPNSLVWRRKEAFSDAVSTTERPWYKIIQEFCEQIYSDDEFKRKCKRYHHNKPYDKESLYYREIFEKHYHNKSNILPYFWKQYGSNKISAWE